MGKLENINSGVLKPIDASMMAGVDADTLGELSRDVSETIRPTDIVIPIIKLAQNNSTAQEKGLCNDGEFYSFESEHNYGSAFVMSVMTTHTRLLAKFTPDNINLKPSTMGYHSYVEGWGAMDSFKPHATSKDDVSGIVVFQEVIACYGVLKTDIGDPVQIILGGGSISTGRAIRTRHNKIASLGYPSFMQWFEFKSVIKQNKDNKSYKSIVADVSELISDKTLIPKLVDTAKGLVKYKHHQDEQNMGVELASVIKPDPAKVVKVVPTEVVKAPTLVAPTPAKASTAPELGGQKAPTNEPEIVDVKSFDFE